MADGDWKGVYPYGFGHSCQLLLNKFFDASTPFMRKVDDGEEKKKKKKKEKKRKKKKKIMTFIVATNVIASRPPKRRPTGTPNARAKITRRTTTSERNKFLQVIASFISKELESK